MWLLMIFIFIFGLIVGSFLNCLIYRLETGQKMTKRSFCPHCKHKLSWQDLIPLLSFLLLKGKCRYCKKRISLQYPLVEASTGILFSAIFWHFNFNLSLDFAFWIFVSCVLVLIFVYDIKHYIIPDKVIYPAIAFTFLYKLFSNFHFLIYNSLLSALFAFLFFLTIILVSRGKWMGFGDAKMAFFMGLLLGFPKILISLFFAFFIGGIIGIILLLSKKKKLKSEVPFGPFLTVGTFIAMFFGENLLNCYLKFLGY